MGRILPMSRLGHRTMVGALILTVWAGMVGWHIRREYFQPELARLLEATTTLAPETYFYALRMNGEVIGTASSHLDTIPDRGGFVLEDRMHLELTAMGQAGTAVTRTRVHLTPALAMEDFSFSLNAAAGSFEARGRVEGDSLLSVEVEAGGGAEELTFRLREPPTFAAALPIRVAMSGQLEVGRTFRFPVFDPSTVSTRTVEVQVLEAGVLTLPDTAMFDPGSGRWVSSGELEVPAWRIVEDFGTVRVESWIDEDGRVLRSSSLMGFSMEKTWFELARQELESARERREPGAEPGDVILSTAVEGDAELGEVEHHDELRFVLSGVELAGFELDGGRQELRGDTLVVRRERWDELEPGYRLPYPRMDLRESLEPEPLIQSGDPRVVREARRAVGWQGRGPSNPLDVTRRLNNHVFGELDKEITLTIPSALQVLDTRRGDCNEHTVLFVAMARALGLPARSAVGVVHLDGSFFYHAWPEVWLGEWVAVDPTLGQAPASAAHIRFQVGGLAQQVEIARLIGNLRIEVSVPETAATQEGR